VARFLGHWRPDLGVFVESELWPTLITSAKSQGARLALVSARMGEDSAEGWGRAAEMARVVLGSFDLVMAQDDEAARRLAELGARDDGRLNLKLAGDPPPVEAKALAAAKRMIGKRPLLLAASTHPGEDALMLEAFRPWRSAASRPLLVIVPRHPVRGPEIAEAVRAQGFVTAVRSTGEAPGENVEVYVADTLGELGLWLSLARLAIMGGSFVEGVGGHNPLEPARLGCPAASGPHVANWASVYAELKARDAVAMIEDEPALSELIGRALEGRDERRAEAALALLREKASAVDEAMSRLEALLP
jgi:3-deoxy-D-manno-octulosonic-acid transferase